MARKNISLLTLLAKNLYAYLLSKAPLDDEEEISLPIASAMSAS
jgi:hypothetical protein